MTVLSVAYPLFPVGPDSSGGAEQILFLLDREIVRAGHCSLVVAATGSSIAGQLIETAAADGLMTEAAREMAHREHRIAIERALSDHHVDVIHFHGLDFNSYVPDADVRMFATMHLPLAWYPPEAIARKHVQLICVSRSQAEGTTLPVVSNGIDIDRFKVIALKQDHLLWIGRVCPEKGTHIALQVAHGANVPLKLAGPVHAFESHQAYFRDQVQPLLDSRRQYLGPVSGMQKSQLLAEARCVLIPSLVAETSSLVAMEAISSGTPVIAFRSGALPEVVDHDKTGLIVDTEAEMTAALSKVQDISPAACRATAESRFNATRMARDYFNLYR